MSDPGELEQLARRYLDLWQDQVRALAEDPEYAEALGRLLRSMGIPSAEAAAALGAWPGAAGDLMRAVGEAKVDDDGGRSRATAAGPEATAAAPDLGDIDLDLVLRRLAALEERVAALETEAQGARRSPRRGGGGRRD